MNKTQMNQILSLRKQGVDNATCVLAILQVVCGYKNSTPAFRIAADTIDKFYQEEVYPPMEVKG